MVTPPRTSEQLQDLLLEQAYLADHGLATSLVLGLGLERPVLLEGEAGVGKTEVARSLAAGLGRRLVRLQCYEGIDAAQALYEWDYARQLLHIRSLDGRRQPDRSVEDVFSPRFLLERPLLAALKLGRDAVLLIDEIDRADDEFEAFLLELLADFQVTVPEIGTISAEHAPMVVLTSNRTRELHDAVKRRCLYAWLDYPDLEREVRIVCARAPDVPERLARQVAEVVQRLRALPLVKPPGVAETIDWVRALAFLGAERLTPEAAEATLGCVVKEHDDVAHVGERLSDLLSG